MRQRLDRETVDAYTLSVRAVDVSRRDVHNDVTVTVSVLDANDNAPLFDTAVYELHVAENTPLGSSIGRVSAVDADVDDNARVLYSLAGADSSCRRARVQLPSHAYIYRSVRHRSAHGCHTAYATC